MQVPFRDRADAGRRLAEKLRAYTNRPDVVVLGLPPGGVPVAEAVADALGAPLEVFLVQLLDIGAWVDAALEEDLVGVDVAHTCQHLLIHEGLINVARAPA